MAFRKTVAHGGAKAGVGRKVIRSVGRIRELAMFSLGGLFALQRAATGSSRQPGAAQSRAVRRLGNEMGDQVLARVASAWPPVLSCGTHESSARQEGAVQSPGAQSSTASDSRRSHAFVHLLCIQPEHRGLPRPAVREVDRRAWFVGQAL